MRAHFLLASVLASCTHGSGGVDPVQIRACNDTELDFDTLEYGDVGNVGPLLAGTCTEYELAESSIYDYAYVKFEIGSDVFEIVPIDFVGETPLPGGRWSYRLTIIDYANRSLQIQAIED